MSLNVTPGFKNLINLTTDRFSGLLLNSMPYLLCTLGFWSLHQKKNGKLDLFFLLNLKGSIGQVSVHWILHAMAQVTVVYINISISTLASISILIGIHFFYFLGTGVYLEVSL